jgi:hypothetical protein
MFAFFGLGPQALVILLVIGALLAAGLAVAVVSLSLTRRPERWGDREVAELRAALKRLREGSAGRAAPWDVRGRCHRRAR